MVQDSDIEVLTPIIRDVNTTSPMRIAVTGQSSEVDSERTIWLGLDGDDSKVGVVLASGKPMVDRFVEIAGQIQDWVLQTLAGHGYQAVWPECREHPGTHPLEAFNEASQPV